MRNTVSFIAVAMSTAAVLVAITPPSRAAAGMTRHGPMSGHARIELYALPANEHWPSNHVPDHYRLRGYGRHDGHSMVCKGDTGMTLSTRRHGCPDGQTPARGERRLSTAP